MKKSILALAALLGTGAMGWAQTTTTGTGTNTTTNSTTTGTNSTTNPGSNTSTNTNTNTSTGSDLNGTSTNNGTNSLNTTSGNMGNGQTSTPVNPNASNTTGTLQSSTAGTDYNSMQNMPNRDTNITMLSTGNYAAYGNATSVPSNLQTSLQQTYPSAFNPTWQQAGDWYRASFNNMNRNMMVYYAPNGNNYTVALPVVQSFVPEEIITKALGMYGSNIYSINRVRSASGTDAYQVTVIEGGVSRTEFIGEDGSTVAAIDVFRNDANGINTMNSSSNNAANADMNSSSNMNNNTNNGSLNNSNLNSGNVNNSNVNSSTTTDMNTTTTDINTDTNMSSGSQVTDPNLKLKHKVKTDDGKIMKTKTKNGKTKVKGDAANANATNGGM
jgi:hypothetical protein